MKKNIIVIAVAVFALLASSCGRKVTYEYLAYATLETASYSFDEDVQEVTVPVKIYNSTGKEVLISVSTTDSKAKEGTDYEVLSPVSGVLAFGPGETSQDIVLGIIEHKGVLTGSKDFSLAIESLTEGFDVGNVNEARLTIKDLDHPLKDFIGVWNASVTGYSGMNYNWDMTVEGDEDDPEYKNLLVSNICPMSSMMYGLTPEKGFNIVDATVDASKTRMTVEMDQYIGSADGEDLMIAGLNAPTLETASSYTDIAFELSANKKKMSVYNAYGTLSSQGLWEVYPGTIVFTKK